MRRGLTLGKFAPFHRGHQMLVETALAEVDELVVMVYATEVIDVPLQVRAGWIRKLYPTARVIEAWDGPDGYGDTPEICREQENYILGKLNGLRITHFYSSEFYGDHVSRALGAVDRRIDESRAVVPISGTALREDYYAGRQYLAPVVYADLITKVCFMGAPSTGKTTLAQTMAEEHNTVWMPEYGAEYWLEHHVNRRITLDQFEEIAPEHNSREDALTLQSRKYLFCDTNPITTYVFAKDYHGLAGPILTRLAMEAENRYDLFFLCDTDIPYADTWDRSGDQKRRWFQDQILGDLAERRIPFFRVRGTLKERVSQVGDVLRRYRKFGNILDIPRMKYLKTIAAVLVPLVIAGCTDSTSQSEPSSPASQLNTNSAGQSDGVVKIAVLTDGTVIVNSEAVPIDSLASRLDSLGDIKEIWYHREAPDADKPHENAMKTIAEIANRQLPIAMYLDRDFTNRATFGE